MLPTAAGGAAGQTRTAEARDGAASPRAFRVFAGRMLGWPPPAPPSCTRGQLSTIGGGDQAYSAAKARMDMRSRIVRAGSRPTKKAPSASFSGVVWQDEVFAPEQPSRVRATRVTFAPGARTNWHTHAVGQILYVLSGV